MNNLEEFERRIEQYPLLPVAVTRVMELLTKKEVDYARLEKEIAQSPALVARVLNIANSSFYGFAGKISSLKQACIVLGVHSIRSIVLAAGVINVFEESDNPLIDTELVWQHSFRVGYVAQILAGSAFINEDEAFTAGLLHDIGELMLGKHYVEIGSYQTLNVTSFINIEHSVVGAKMAEHWHLPHEIVQAIEYHHKPNDQNAPKLSKLINLSDEICCKIEQDEGVNEIFIALKGVASDSICIEPEIFRQCLTKISNMQLQQFMVMI